MTQRKHPQRLSALFQSSAVLVSASKQLKWTTDTGSSLDAVVYFKPLTATAHYYAFYDIVELENLTYVLVHASFLKNKTAENSQIFISTHQGSRQKVPYSLPVLSNTTYSYLFSDSCYGFWSLLLPSSVSFMYLLSWVQDDPCVLHLCHAAWITDFMPPHLPALSPYFQWAITLNLGSLFLQLQLIATILFLVLPYLLSFMITFPA